MASLFTLVGAYADAYRILEEGEGELTPELEEALFNLEGATEKKIENIEKMIRAFRAQALAAKAEVADLRRVARFAEERATALENRRAQALEVLEASGHGQTSFITAFGTARLTPRRSARTVSLLVEPGEVPEALWRVVPEQVIPERREIDMERLLAHAEGVPYDEHVVVTVDGVDVARIERLSSYVRFSGKARSADDATE